MSALASGRFDEHLIAMAGDARAFARGDRARRVDALATPALATPLALPLRVMREYEFRDKFDDGKCVYMHCASPKGTCVVGKARKVADGDGRGARHALIDDVRAADTPPHALKLIDVSDWCVRYGGDEPEKWLVTSRAWYKLEEPTARYEKYVATATRRAKFTNAVVRGLMVNWGMTLEEGLKAILSVPVVPHDVPMAVRAPTKAARLSGTREEEEVAGGGEVTDKESAAHKYTHADIVGDGFFIVSQLSTLVKGRALRAPGTSATEDAAAPTVLVELQNWTTERHTLGNMTKAMRLERERSRRERVKLDKMAEEDALKKPREPRLTPPPPASPALPKYSHVGPMLQTEVLTLWDYTQVFGEVLQCPPCPLDRFADVFLGADLGAAEVAVWRDVMVAFMRVIEARGGAIDCKSVKSRPKMSRWWDTAVFGIDDLNELDWCDRANMLVQDLKDNPVINARVRNYALEAAAQLEQGATVEQLAPTLRVGLATVLSAIAMESEAFHDYVTMVADRARANRSAGEFHMTPPLLADNVPKETETNTAKAKGDGDDASVKEEVTEAVDDAEVDGATDADAMEADDVESEVKSKTSQTLTEYRRSQLMKWRSEAIDRAVINHGKPVAVDEQGRRYFALGGLNNAGQMFVETAPEGWHAEDVSPKRIVDDEEVPKQPMAGPPVEAWAFKEDFEDLKERARNVSGLVEYASRWGLYTPGPSLDALSEWCNPSYDNERFITRVHKLITHSIDGMEDVDAQLEASVLQERVQSLCSTMIEDGYSHLDGIPVKCDLVTRLINVLRFIVHSLPFWRSPDGWLRRFTDTCARIDSLSAKSESVLVDVLKVLPAIEVLCRDCYMLNEAAWAESRPTWLAQLRFYIYGPRTEAELHAAAQPGLDVGGNDRLGSDFPGCKDVRNALELVDALPPLNVRRTANLLNQLIRYEMPDVKRLSAEAFMQSTGISSGAPLIKPGATVALIKRGLTKTYNRYVLKKNRPRNWIDIDTLRPFERCIVLSTAYRASDPSESVSDDSETPPCTWLMCLLLDAAETPRVVDLRKKVNVKEEEVIDEEDDDDENKNARRIVMAPVYAGGDVADYVIDFSKFEDSRNKPWAINDRIMMQFEGVAGGDESNGIVSTDAGVFYLGRVRRVRVSPDFWETVQVVFDSDPEDWMWVSPWEIVAAPEKYHDPVFDGPGAIDPDRQITEDDIAEILRSKAIARKLGWPGGTKLREFDRYRSEAYRGNAPIAPTFCHAPLDIYRVFIETMHLGGYRAVTRNKFWKQVARTLGRDLATQTSASFALRTTYERCIHQLEQYLSSPEMVRKLELDVSQEGTMDAFPGTVPNVVRDDDYEDEDDEGDRRDFKKAKKTQNKDEDDEDEDDEESDADEASDEVEDSDSDFVR